MVYYEQALSMWRNKKIKTAADLAAVINGQNIAFAYNSCRIENEQVTYHDTYEIFDRNGVVNYTGDLRTLFEIRNAKDASDLFLRCFGERAQVTMELICGFHYELTKNTYDQYRWEKGERPGELKKSDYVVGEAEIGAAAADTEEELEELLQEIRATDSDDALTVAAYFHAKFENIHPFADGNGRCGRLVMNYILVTMDHPPITVFADDKQAYYDALDAWHSTQDLTPLKRFLKEQAAKTWARQLEREGIVTLTLEEKRTLDDYL